MSLKKYLCLILCFCFAVISINAQPVSDFDELKSKWIKNYNQEGSQLFDITKHYLYGGAVFLNDTIFQNNYEIFSSLFELKKNFPSIINFHTIEYFGNDSLNYFEIGKYSVGNSESDTLYYIIAWKKISCDWFRELEIIYPKSGTLTGNNRLAEIDKARNKWVETANTNNPVKLVHDLYTQNASYFNSTNVSRGQDGISAAYNYMSNPNWKMKDLVSRRTIFVQPDLAFEVGQWQMGSYSGLYTLIWKKTNNEWKAVLDFNF